MYTPYSFRGSFSPEFACLSFLTSLRLFILVTIPSSQMRKVIQSHTAFRQDRLGND